MPDTVIQPTPEVTSPQQESMTATPENFPSSGTEPDFQESESGEKVSPDQNGAGGLEIESVNGKEKSAVRQMMAVIGKIFLMLAGILLILAAGWGILLGNRERILKRRKSLFFQKNTNKGICEISYGLSQMLKDAGVAEDRLYIESDDVEYARRMEKILECVNSGE